PRDDDQRHAIRPSVDRGLDVSHNVMLQNEGNVVMGEAMVWLAIWTCGTGGMCLAIRSTADRGKDVLA
ncbi:hypothetical protein, partial [Arsenicicoccus bolidensis]|uniref:hypothetical protein n=1 Tax=Arsenicicoccus bolidensis TaxID=229480 RepID=UPI0028A72BE8